METNNENNSETNNRAAKNELVCQKEIVMETPIEFKKIQGGRLTIHDSIFFQENSENPISNVTSYEIKTMTTEQPYTRRMKIPSKWVPLDLGWLINNHSIVIVEFKEKEDNPENYGSKLSKQVLLGISPTNSRIITFAKIDMIVKTIKFAPYSGESIFIKSENGEHKVEIMVFPK